MKRIILGLALISLVFCSEKSCLEEDDKTKCSTHSVEYNGFSCYPFSYEDDENEYGCSSFPDNGNTQKAYFKLANGMFKEIYSCYPGLMEDDDILDIPQFSSKKETYNKGEEIILKFSKISKSDMEIINSNKTCSYYYYGRIFDYLEDIAYDYSKYKGYPNIENKNICFNAKQFPDLKDLIDCGFATIKYNNGRKDYEIKTCFYIPNNKMPEELGKYLKSAFIDLVFTDGTFSEVLEAGTQYDDETNYDGNTRLLSTANSYEVVVEDKNGKKIKWTDSSTDIEVIEEGNNSNMFVLNIILLLSLILLY